MADSPIISTQLSPRITRLKIALEADMMREGQRVTRTVFSPAQWLEKEQLRTASYAATEGQPLILRRARSLAHIAEHITPIIAEGEWIVGSQKGNLWFCDAVATAEQITQRDAIYQEAARFGIANGEGHVVVDYATVLARGLRGLDADAAARLQAPDLPSTQREFFEAIRLALRSVRRFAERHAEAAEALASSCPDAARTDELRAIARICRKVPWEPSETFHEALQAFWSLHIFLHIENPSVAISPGRMDQYLYPTFHADLTSGRLTRDEACELIACLLLKLHEGEESQNALVGGTDRDGRDVTNELSLLLIETVGDLRAFQPTLSVRVHPDSPPEYLQAAARLVATGIGQPSFFNDEVVVDSLVWLGIDLRDAREYAIVGCYEATIPGRENGRTVAGCVPLPPCVLRALETEPPSFDALLEAFRREVALDITATVAAAQSAETHMADCAPSALLSAVVQDCIATATEYHAGGAHYNFSGIYATGWATALDSLVAVQRLVYERGLLSLTEVREALGEDFAGREDLRLMMLRAAPKFGNGDSAVDELARSLGGFFCREVAARRTSRGPCQPGLNSFNNHLIGLPLGATPDGRHAHMPFSAGIGPNEGCNRSGLSATLDSAAAFDHRLAPNGDSLNLTLDPAVVHSPQGLTTIVSMVREYFARGGFHLHMNVVDAETLRQAQREPQRYGDLIVRVAGFSAHFVALPRELQDNIIARLEAGL